MKLVKQKAMYFLTSVIGLTLFISVVSIGTPALAQTCAGVETAVLGEESCGDSTDTTSGLQQVITWSIRVLVGLVGIAAVIAIIAAGIRYAAAGNNQSEVVASRTMIINTIVGIVLFGLTTVAINFIVPGGVFSDSGSSTPWFTSNGQQSEKNPTGTAPSPVTWLKPAPPSAISNPGGSAGSKSTITLASWNTYVNNANKVGPIAASLISSADVIGLQEVHRSDQRRSVKSAASSSVGVHFAPTPSSGDKHMASYPIVYNKTKFSIVSSGYQRLGSVSGLSDRYAVYINFKVKATNQQFYFVNTHLPPSVEYGGKPGSDTSMNSAYKTLGSKLKSVLNGLQSSGKPIFLAGDFNVNFRRDNCSVSWYPCALLSPINIKAGFKYKLSNLSSSQGTHGTGNRLIDYIFVWERPGTTVDSVSVIGGSGNGWRGSDHKPSLTKVTIETPRK